MSLQLQKSEAARLAHDVLMELEYSSLPIDPFAIAQKKGILVKAMPATG